MGCKLSSFSVLRAGMVLLCLWASPPGRAGETRTYQSAYYTLTTDFDPPAVRDLLFRLDHLAVQFKKDFPSLRGAVTHKYKMFVFRDPDAFAAAGGPPVDARGNYSIPKQTAYIVRPKLDQAFQPMQSIGFLQYCNESIGNLNQIMPDWVLRGLEQYYYYSQLSGDDYTCTLLPDGALEDLQNTFQQKTYRPLAQLMSLPELENIHDAHQAWWLVMFLHRGENGRYRPAFSRYLHDVARGITHKEAWKKEFGDIDIEKSWLDWMATRDRKSVELEYAKACAKSMAAYYGRALKAGQQFTRSADLMTAIRSRSLNLDNEDWLPDTVGGSLLYCLDHVAADTRYALSKNADTPSVDVLLGDQSHITATYNPSSKDRRITLTYKQPGQPARPLDDTADDAIPDTIVLQSARFGAGTQWVDVTDKCQNMVVGDLVLTPRSLKESLGIDPASGGVNWLDLRLVINGKAVRITVSDNRSAVPLRLTTQLPAEQEDDPQP